MRPTNGTPTPNKTPSSHHQVSEPLSCFGVPVSVFCTNQTPLFYSFGKCTKITNNALRLFALILHLFLTWQQSPISLGRSISYPPCTHHYDNHSQFIPSLEVLTSPVTFPFRNTYDCRQAAQIYFDLGPLNPHHLFSATAHQHVYVKPIMVWLRLPFCRQSTPLFQKGSGTLDSPSPYKGLSLGGTMRDIIFHRCNRSSWNSTTTKAFMTQWYCTLQPLHFD